MSLQRLTRPPVLTFRQDIPARHRTPAYPNGTAAFNFWSGPYLTDQIRRLSRVLHIRDRRSTSDNVVIICGTLPISE